jgi:uncharacterized membrane protein YeiH
VILADAFGLALFGVAGTEKALALGSPGLVAIVMGVITAVAGGILRDVLRREVPTVFQPEIELYATAVFFGALVLVILRLSTPASESHRFIAMTVILALRLAALRWKLRLPIFRLSQGRE